MGFSMNIDAVSPVASVAPEPASTGGGQNGAWARKGQPPHRTPKDETPDSTPEEGHAVNRLA
jgi:hypothetical protein